MYEAITQLFQNISLFGTGMLFGMLGLTFGIMRGMTKDSALWPVIFGAFAWTLALIIPNAGWSAGVFLAGAIAVTIAFIEPMKKMNESNIFYVAIITGIMNLILLFAFGAYSTSLDWGDNLGTIQTDVQTLLGQEAAAFSADAPGHGLCTPSQERAGICVSSAIGGTFNPLIFDVFASVIAIGTYISKALTFAGMAILSPVVIGYMMKDMVQGSIAAILMGIYVTFWQLIILYNIIKFVLNKRGMG